MATVTVSPTVPRVGQPLVIAGEDFTAAAVVTVTIDSEGISTELLADAGGNIGSDDPADAAVATFTLAGVPIADETVVIGANTYVWKAAPTTVANEVKIGATASASLDNLRAAIEAGAGSGSLYGSATVVHPTVEVVTKTASTLVLNAKTGGTAGNSLASTETTTGGSFGGAVFSGGSAATGVSSVIWTPTKPGTYRITASDGTESDTVDVRVWASG